MPLVIVALAGQGAAIGQLQITQRSLQSLDRGLLVHAQHNGLRGRGDIEADNIRGFGRKVRVVALTPGLAAARSILWLRRNRQTYWTSTSPSAPASRGPVQRANPLPAAACPAASESACQWPSYRSAAYPVAACLAALQGLGRHSDAAKGWQSAAGPQLPWRSSGCCAHPPPTELSAPASNRAATSSASDSTPQAPCDLSSKGGLLLLRVSSIS